MTKRTPVQAIARVATIGFAVLAAAVFVAPWVLLADERGQRTAAEQALTAEQDAHAETVAYWRGIYTQLFESTGGDTTAPSPVDAAQAAPSLVQGAAGAPGATGAQGPRGEPGVPGPIGPPGPSGEPGVDGEDGAAGPIGPPGPNGQVGSTGSNGVDGAQGPTGATGPQGETGSQGPAGADGRGIASLVCDDAGRWQVTYTDGTAADAGACRADSPTTEEPGIDVPLPILDP